MTEYAAEGHRMGVFTVIVSMSIVVGFIVNTLIFDVLLDKDMIIEFTLFVLSVSPTVITLAILKLVPVKYQLMLSGIPDIRGHYSGELLSSHTNMAKSVPVNFEIIQTLFDIDVKMNVGTSISHNTMASLSKNGCDAVLKYTYDNTVVESTDAMKDHTGMCTLYFSENNVNGRYYNNPDRGTYGSITLKRIRKND